MIKFAEVFEKTRFVDGKEYKFVGVNIDDVDWDAFCCTDEDYHSLAHVHDYYEAGLAKANFVSRALENAIKEWEAIQAQERSLIEAKRAAK